MEERGGNHGRTISRIDLTVDDSLRNFLEHNREEEKEHGSMLLKWVRRNDETFASEMKTYLLRDRGDPGDPYSIS